MSTAASSTTPVFPEVESHFEKIRFLNRLKTIERFAYVYLGGTAQQIRSKRDELEAGKELLDDPAVIAICDELIGRFEARLFAIPHERYLRENL